MSVNYGSRRLVVGARYGLRDWLMQRVTGTLMAVFTLLLLVQVLFSSGPLGYDSWSGIFAAQWMKVLTFVTLVSLGWHAWVGVRDVVMDYVRSAAARLVLHVLVLVWLVGCMGWAVQVLWRL